MRALQRAWNVMGIIAAIVFIPYFIGSMLVKLNWGFYISSNPDFIDKWGQGFLTTIICVVGGGLVIALLIALSIFIMTGRNVFNEEAKEIKVHDEPEEIVWVHNPTNWATIKKGKKKKKNKKK